MMLGACTFLAATAAVASALAGALGDTDWSIRFLAWVGVWLGLRAYLA